jgi:hypothetical protein
LPDELAWAAVVELALRVRTRQLSPVDVVETFMDCIDRRDREGLGANGSVSLGRHASGGGAADMLAAAG